MGNGEVRRPSKNLGGRPKGFSPSQTDLIIIQGIVRHGFQTFHELHRGELGHWPESSLWRRLKRLVSEGCLFKIKGDKGQTLGWTVNPKGVSTHFMLSEEAAQEARRAPVYKTAFAHDLELRSIRETLGACKAVVAWVPEHVLKAQVMRRFQHLHPRDRREKLIAVPDALLSLQSGGEESKAALELELTQKSKRRLYQKIETYVTSDDFDYAFFIAGDEHLKGLLMDVYDRVLSQSPRAKFAKQQNGIYFATLEAVQEQGLRAKFKSRHDSLTFADLG